MSEATTKITEITKDPAFEVAHAQALKDAVSSLVPPGPLLAPQPAQTIKETTTEISKPPWLTADGHINLSAIVGIICAIGYIWGPEYLKDKFTATGIAAAGWLGASAKVKQ